MYAHCSGVSPLLSPAPHPYAVALALPFTALPLPRMALTLRMVSALCSEVQAVTQGGRPQCGGLTLAPAAPTCQKQMEPKGKGWAGMDKRSVAESLGPREGAG